MLSCIIEPLQALLDKGIVIMHSGNAIQADNAVDMIVKMLKLGSLAIVDKATPMSPLRGLYANYIHYSLERNKDPSFDILLAADGLNDLFGLATKYLNQGDDFALDVQDMMYIEQVLMEQEGRKEHLKAVDALLEQAFKDGETQDLSALFFKTLARYCRANRATAGIWRWIWRNITDIFFRY